ncbi:hypothetical protein [Archangium violaceum]|nr:hypothetical protein [Archangium violaceum]
MGGENPRHCTDFTGHRRIASGALDDVALKAKELVARPTAKKS